MQKIDITNIKKNNMDLSLNKIKISFEYNSEKLSISAEQYITLKKLKEKALTHFFQCPKDIKLYYLNKDITDNENEQIGILFSGKKNVDIKLKSSYNKEKKIKDKKFTNLLKENTKSQIMMDDKSYKKLIEEIKPKKSKNSDNFICECKNKNIVNKYCRICNEFICEICFNNNHKNHYCFEINRTNLGHSVQIYQKILCEEINKKLELSQNMNNSTNHPLLQQNKVILQRLKDIYDKYEQIEIKVQEKIKKLNVIEFMNELKDKSTNMKNEIEYVTKTVDVNNKNGLIEFEHYFGLINDIEKKYKNSNEKSNKIIIDFNELQYKLFEMNNKIDKEIDEFFNLGLFNKLDN